MRLRFNDRQLAQLARVGNLAAYEALVLRHEQQVYTRALKSLRNEHDAHFVTQDTFLRMLEDGEAIDETGSFRSWLFRLVTESVEEVARQKQSAVLVPMNGAAREKPSLAPARPRANGHQAPGRIGARLRRAGRQLAEPFQQLLSAEFAALTPNPN